MTETIGSNINPMKPSPAIHPSKELVRLQCLQMAQQIRKNGNATDIINDAARLEVYVRGGHERTETITGTETTSEPPV
jgi:hypothetical protein